MVNQRKREKLNVGTTAEDRLRWLFRLTDPATLSLIHEQRVMVQDLCFLVEEHH